MKKNYAVNTRIRFVNTGSSELDGKLGTILGTACISQPITDDYIVLLDEPLSYSTNKAIVITEACLESPIKSTMTC